MAERHDRRTPRGAGVVVDLSRWRARRAGVAPGPGSAAPPELSRRPRLVGLLGVELERHLPSLGEVAPGRPELLQQAREVIEHRLQAALGPLLTPAEWAAFAGSRLAPAEALALLRRIVPHVDAVVTELLDELRRDLDLWLEAVRKAGDPGPAGPPPGPRPRGIAAVHPRDD